MKLFKNKYRGSGIPTSEGMEGKAVSVNAAKVLDLLEHCPVAKQTELHDHHALAAELGIARLYIKDERERMGLGSFKSTGAAYVIALAASQAIEASDFTLETATPEQLRTLLPNETYICSTAGNHGLSIAAGARVFGAKAVIYLSDSVPEVFAERLKGYGAEVVRHGESYEDSFYAARARAEQEGWTMLSDTSWPGYTEIPTQIMEGYLIVSSETVKQLEDEPMPTHIMLQAGVGGVAASATAYFRDQWKDVPMIVIAEPDAAPALMDSVEAGKPIEATGPVSSMGRLDCKEPSHVALGCLSREVDWFVTLSDEAVESTTDWLAAAGIASTPSATAGLAVVQQSKAGDEVREQLGLDENSRVLVIITERA